MSSIGRRTTRTGRGRSPRGTCVERGARLEVRCDGVPPLQGLDGRGVGHGGGVAVSGPMRTPLAVSHSMICGSSRCSNRWLVARGVTTWGGDDLVVQQPPRVRLRRPGPARTPHGHRFVGRRAPGPASTSCTPPRARAYGRPCSTSWNPATARSCTSTAKRPRFRRAPHLPGGDAPVRATGRAARRLRRPRRAIRHRGGPPPARRAGCRNGPARGRPRQAATAAPWACRRRRPGSARRCPAASQSSATTPATPSV